MADLNTENGNPEEGSGEALQNTHPTPLLRPSAFRPSTAPASQGILAPSRLGNNPFVGRAPVAHTASDVMGISSAAFPNNPFAARLSTHDDGVGHDSKPAKLLLRPSALDKQTAGFGSSKDGGSNYKSSFKLEPAQIKSPFSQNNASELQKQAKSPPDVEQGAKTESQEPEASSVPTQAQPGAQSEEVKQRLFGGDTSSETPNNVSKPENQSGGSAGGFVFGQKMEDRVTVGPSSSPSSAAAEPSTSSSGASGFVFGQNLSERVVATPHKDKEKGPPPEDQAKVGKDAEARDEQIKETCTLEESAAQYKARQARPELAEVDVKTGEEEESNVFQVNAKLYVFDKPTQSWIEKGRGLLRLNDMLFKDSDSFQSRLVMRMQGSLRVVLNTKIWAAMTIERASPKSIRISAVDPDEGVKIFLIMASLKDSDQIFSAIDSRVQQLKAQEHASLDRSGPLEEEDEGGALSSQNEAGPSPTVQVGVPCQMVSPPSPVLTDKRHRDGVEENAPVKKRRMDPEHRRDTITEESNDSSTVDPETEASNESFASSPTIKSSSSDA